MSKSIMKVWVIFIFYFLFLLPLILHVYSNFTLGLCAAAGDLGVLERSVELAVDKPSMKSANDSSSVSSCTVVAYFSALFSVNIDWRVLPEYETIVTTIITLHSNIC